MSQSTSLNTRSHLHDTGTNSSSTTTTDAGPTKDESLTPLEQEVLDEYTLLLSNLSTLNTLVSSLSGAPSTAVLDALRGLERKTSLVFTLLKASVYSIVLQQQIGEEGTEGGG